MDVQEFKKRILELDKDFTDFVVGEMINEPYVYIVPVNKFEEEKRFFHALSKGLKYEPSFKYENRRVKRTLKRLEWFKNKFSELEYPEEIIYLKEIYERKINELMVFAEITGSAGEEKFYALSLKAYGKPGFFLSSLATFTVFVSGVADSFKVLKSKTYVSKQDIIRRFNLFCRKHRFEGWELEFSKKILSVAFVLPSQKKVIINESMKFTAAEIQMLFRHELGVHGSRHVNGKNILGVFSFGLADYDELEEGLATFEEFGFYNPLNVLFMPALKAVAVRSAINNGFYGTFQRIHALTGNVELSFSMAMRTKRGTYMNKGAYTKDYLYFSGFLKVLWYFLKGFGRSSRIDELFIGKIGFRDIPRMDELKRIKDFFSDKTTITRH